MKRVTGRAARRLRALGHSLKPTVTVGRDGVTAAVVATAEANLSAHELIKVKVGPGCPLDRQAVAAELAGRTGAAVAQLLGRTILLYRAGEEPRIQLPPCRAPEK
ncbi:MAG: ribosome assembly RNA-binding protein YhbY [Deferrisomatales bacterium]